MDQRADVGTEGFTTTLHRPRPDYSQPLLEISPEARERLLGHLRFLYGEEVARAHLPEFERILKVYYAHKAPEMIERDRAFDPKERFTEKDMILITYGDLVRGEERSHLATLAKFCEKYLRTVNTLHLLPFFPYSSDRGFSVIDFRAVDPNLGSWGHIVQLEGRYQLMIDGVINHVSSKSIWFQEFLNGKPEFQDFFIVYHSPDDLTVEERGKIFRPRTSDILTRYQTINGPLYVWTTFSEDQIDLNYKSPRVLLGIVELLLFYVTRGVDIVRLDAVTYIWAEPGTSCVHLEQAHEIIKFFRTVLNLVAPHVALITETNVPHAENVSYFGDGRNEAQMVYNFALPPLVLHTFYTGDATTLTRWARDLKYPSDEGTFFNILDTHDGVGLMGARGILAGEEIGALVERARAHGAFISWRTGEGGVEEPYEINTTWWSAVNRDDAEEDLDFQVKRFVASRSIADALKGIPGIYLHGAIGTENDPEVVVATGSNREVNRQVVDIREVDAAVRDPHSKLSRIGRRIGKIHVVRTEHRAFHPRGAQRVLELSPDVFAVLRTSPEEDQHILALTSVVPRAAALEVDLVDLGVEAASWYDLISKREFPAKGSRLPLTLEPYDVIWLMPFAEIEKNDIAFL